MTHVNSGGGAITSVPQDFVFIEDLLVAVDGSIGTGHPPCPIVPIHCGGAWATSGGADFVTIEGIPVNHETNVDTCGHSRVGGCDFVFIEP